MGADASSTAPHCPACNAPLKIGEVKCWLCGAAVAPIVGEAPATRPAVTPPSPTIRGATSFSLSTLMMFMTIVAVVCGVFSIAPGVGAVMAVVLLPVLSYTAISARREAAMGYRLGASDRVMLFFGSLGIVVATGLAASIAFGATCAAGFWAGAAAGDVMRVHGNNAYDGLEWGFFAGFGLGTIAAIFVGYRVLIAMSRKSVLGHEDAPALSRTDKITLALALFLAVIIAIVACLYLTYR